MSDIRISSKGNAAENTEAAGQQRLVDAAKRLSSQAQNSPAQIEKAASGFESLLLQQMLKEMWATVPVTGLMGEDSNAARIYRDMLNQAIADTVSEGQGIGVKDFLKQELVKQEQPQKLATTESVGGSVSHFSKLDLELNGPGKKDGYSLERLRKR